MSSSSPGSTAASPALAPHSGDPQISRWRDRYVYWAALIALVLVSVGFGAIAPSLSTILAELSVSASVGSLLVSAIGAGRLIGGFPAGMGVSQFGPGKVILVGCGIFTAGSVAAWISPTFPVLVVGRLLQGVGLGVVPAGVLAGMMSGARAERAGGSMALYQSGLILGGAIGPAVGGPIAELYDWRAALLFCIIAGLVAMGLAAPLAARSRQASSGPAKPRERLGLSALVVVIVVLLPHLATFLFRMSVSQLGLPLYATGPGGLDQTEAGLMLGTMGLVGLVVVGPAGWATNRYGVRPVVGWTTLTTSLAVAAIPFVPTPYGLWVAAFVFNSSLAIMGVATGLLVFTLTGYSTGALVGIYRLTADVTQVVSPLLIGPIMDQFGYVPGFLLMAVFGLLALASLAFRPGSRTAS